MNGPETAVISIGSAVIGGVIVGAASLFVANRQACASRIEASHDRSVTAAQRAAEALIAFESAVVVWQADADVAALRQAFNGMSIALGAERLAILDSDVRHRLDTHIAFAARCAEIALKNAPATALMIEAFRRHSDAVQDALGAHIRDETMPAYSDPDFQRPDLLVSWTTPPSGSTTGRATSGQADS